MRRRSGRTDVTAPPVAPGPSSQDRLRLCQVARDALVETPDVEAVGQATDDAGRLLFNYPAIPSGGRTVTFERGHGLITLSCTVHGDAEPPARILVVSHPFAARTDGDGRFRFEDVPAGALTVSAWDDAGGEVTTVATVRPGAEAEVILAGP